MNPQIHSDYKPRNSMIKIIFILTLALAIPITVTVVQQQQDIRQRAAEEPRASVPVEKPQTMTISGYVYSDVNVNGKRDPLEKPLSNMQIQISGQSLVSSQSAKAKEITSSSTVTSDANGYFTYTATFFQSVPVSFQIALLLPSGYRSTTPATLFSTQFSDKVVQFGVTNCTIKPACLDATTNKCTVTEPPAGWCPTQNIIDGQVYIDTNKNSLKDQGEVFYTQPLNVTLLKNNVLVARTILSTNGHFLFSGLADGVYHVSLSLPEGYFTSDGTNTTPDDQTVVLPDPQSIFGTDHKVLEFPILH